MLELPETCFMYPAQPVIIIRFCDVVLGAPDLSQIKIYDQQNEFELVKEEKIKCHLWRGTYTTEIVDG